MTNQKSIAKLLLILLLFVCSMVQAPTVSALNEDNVGGFAWSENVGWISFNNSAVDGVAGGGGANNYGVGIDQNARTMSGYAWSENVGWVSFNTADVQGCNGCAGAACTATVDSNPVGGNYPVSGWARVISACKDDLWNGTNCTGGGAGNLAGGWDGCLKFKDSYIDNNGDFYGWMTSSADPSTGVVGWVNLNSANCNGTNCTANAAYKVHTSVTFGLAAAMECGGICPGGDCHIFSDPDPWVMYAPTGDCSTCAYQINNVSEPAGTINCTHWEILGTAYEGTYDGRQNLTFDASVPLGVRTLRLTVSDTPRASNDDHCSLGVTGTAEHQIDVRKEVKADFMCSLDDPAVIADPVWLDCKSATFKKKIMKGEKIFLTDDAALGMHSEESEDGTQIEPTSRAWTITSDGSTATGDQPVMSFTAGKNNTLKLEVTDDASRTNCKIIDNLNGKSLPKWQEVNPVSMIIDNLYASLSKLFGSSASK